jgi:hypothetical protein
MQPLVASLQNEENVEAALSVMKRPGGGELQDH